MQHLVVYTGEHVERPVAQRTREQQDNIIEVSRKLGRPVTFGDLAKRWAADRGYAKNIETVAELFRKNHCLAERSAQTGATAAAFVQPNKLGATPPANEVEPPKASAGRPSSQSLVRTIWRRGDPVPPAPQRASPRAVPTAAVMPAVDGDVPVAVAPIAIPVSTPGLDVPAPAAAIRPARVAIESAEPREQPQGAARFAMAAEGAVSTGAIPAPETCRIYSASYGGSQAVLIRAKMTGETRFTALTVEERSAKSMAESYVASHAPGGEVLGSYDSQGQALIAARRLCPAD